MKASLSLILAFIVTGTVLHAQERCRSFAYQQERVQKDPGLKPVMSNLEKFTKEQLNSANTGRLETNIIRIPVVVHVLYHLPDEKISDAQVQSQIDILNSCFNKRNSDTALIPSYFKSLAADCEIEFALATSDPLRRYTTGIVKKYTPVSSWTMDDKMKQSAETGDDPWDPQSYLNIWVCKLDRFAGYSSVPGDDAAKDGVVIDFNAFGLIQGKPAYGQGKTAVHEIGHWLNLKHLWGDEYCGDDGVDDTPKQASYTPGCPTGIRITCGNGPNGDLYMDYMDFTSDECLHMFTYGQKARMRALFAPGGPRYSMLFSKGLNTPLIFDIPLPDADPRWLEARIYPNPARNSVTLDLSYDPRWVGKLVQVTNLQGQVVMTVPITSKIQTIDLSRLLPGMYFLAAKKEDGLSIREKIIKL